VYRLLNNEKLMVPQRGIEYPRLILPVNWPSEETVLIPLYPRVSDVVSVFAKNWYPTVSLNVVIAVFRVDTAEEVDRNVVAKLSVDGKLRAHTVMNVCVLFLFTADVTTFLSLTSWKE
jgi:hypothetical protein